MHSLFKKFGQIILEWFISIQNTITKKYTSYIMSKIYKTI
jgi:hypothetical protein